MKSPALVLPFLFLSVCSTAQNMSAYAGARAEGLSGASLCNIDVWAAHHNVAATARLEQVGIGLSHQNRFLLREFALSHAALVYPTSVGSVNFAVMHFGFTHYNETRIGIGFARGFGSRLSIGLQVNYHHFFVAEASEQPRSFTGELGFLVQALPGLHIGVHLFNINQADLGDALHEQFPLQGRLGLQYALTDAVKTAIEVQKSLGIIERYALGLEYVLTKVFVLRSGIQLPHRSNSFGVGLCFRRFSADFSYAYRSDLGSNGNVSLQYLF